MADIERAGGPRVLIFSADIGEGHDLPARLLADAIRARRPDANVPIVDSLEAAGRVVHRVIREGSERTLTRFPRAYDASYFTVTRVAPIRWVASRAAYRLARPGLAAVIADVAPDVIVSTYPGVNEVLGHMRRRGELDIPLVSAITDLAALRFWAHPQFDLHLMIHAESAAEVRARAGTRTRVAHVSGLTDPRFLEPRDGAAARRELDLPDGEPVVLISGGGWGVGDLEGATRVALEVASDATVVVLCGRNDAMRTRFDELFAGEDRVRTIGFTDRMPDWLAAADVLIHSTAGLTVLEAQIRGTRVISYGWGVGHIRANNRAYRDFGLADVASSPSEVGAALASALRSPRAPDLSLAELASAADLVLELVP
ncbi:MAG: processive 1,2-diacylglycerol beta-glucosyltransferase [Thermoleophilales bacterium]|nr:processive 1,2-diacylglycerol beta-glucosyltransferase [Thermoleophilales bacterium]